MFLNHIDHHLKNTALCYTVVRSFLDIVGLPSEKIILGSDSNKYNFFPSELISGTFWLG